MDIQSRTIQDMKLTVIPDRQKFVGRPDGITYDRPINEWEQRCGEAPIKIGEVRDKAAFSRLLGFHPTGGIKASGSLTYDLTSDHSHILDVIQQIAEYEASHSLIYLERRCSVDLRQTFVKAGFKQVSQEWHPDNGLLNQHINIILSDHIYMVADKYPTLFQARRLNNAFNELSGVEGPQEGLSFQAEPYGIYLTNNYGWHASPAVGKDCVRTFLRMTYRAPEAYEALRLTSAQRAYLGLSI